MYPQTLIAALFAFVSTAYAIVGGTPATVDDLPFIVAISTTSFVCGGILISPTAVLTDPQCVDGRTAAGLKVRAGSLRHATGGAFLSVALIDAHEGYVKGQPANRIALLHLAKPVPTRSGNRDITPAVLSLPLIEYPIQTSNLVVGGWGTTSSGSGSFAAALRRVEVQAISLVTCQSAYPDLKLTDEIFCNGLRGGGKSPCDGDQGGPVVNDLGQVVGLIQSPYHGCAAPNFPSISTYLGAYSLWITVRVIDLP